MLVYFIYLFIYFFFNEAKTRPITLVVL